MNSSLKLFSVRGIDVRLHVTFPLIIIWAAIQFGLLAGNLSSAIFGVTAIVLLFVLVTMHELGHSFAAQNYGVPVKQIVLSPLGGVAQLSRIPENPLQEFVIAIAGPAVNFFVAIFMGVIALTFGLDLDNVLLALTGELGFGLGALFSYVFVYNIFLALFNLLPAFPLDGGRVFRSLLAMRLDYLRATNIAASVGKATAVALGLWGLLNGGFFLILIAIFIYTGAGQEAAQVTLRRRLRGIKVGQVYSPDLYRLNMDSTVQQASNLMIFRGQRYFPVLEGDRLVGFFTEADLIRAIPVSAPHSLVSRFMRRDVQAVDPSQDLYEVYERFNEEGVDALPVVSNGRFLGIIARRNLFDLGRLLETNPNVILQEQSA